MAELEIHHSYIIKEDDIIKMGNAIFKIKMIQINENDNEPKGKIMKRKITITIP